MQQKNRWWTQLRNKLFPKDPLNIQERALEDKADATAEQGFLKRPPFFWSMVNQKWMQLRNRQFPKEPLKIQSLLTVDATAQQAFSEGPSNF